MDERLVLVVENDAGLREVLADVVGFLGFSVKVARDAAEAVEVARQTAPSAILLDTACSRGTDVAGAALLRQHPSTNTVPLIALQDVSPFNGRRASLVQATETLSRPFNLVDLERSLKRHATGVRIGG